MIKIYKQILHPERNEIEGCVGVLSVGAQNNKPVLWFKHCDDGPCFMTVEVAMTGEACPNGEFVGTFQIQEPGFGEIVGHVFRIP